MAVAHGHGNPDWTRDETILVLNLYFDCEGKNPRDDDPRLARLSDLLRSLPYHTLAARRPTFRNAAGVAFKLQNFRQLATGRGLDNVAKMDRSIWAEFGHQPAEVRRLAKLIQEAVDLTGPATDAEEDDSEEFYEGRQLTRIHKERERHPGLRTKLLAARGKRGPLTCDLCREPAPEHQYGEAVFEGHHTLPISSGERVTKIKDMALLCANCHRIVHRAIAQRREWLSVDAVRDLPSWVI